MTEQNDDDRAGDDGRQNWRTMTADGDDRAGGL